MPRTIRVNVGSENKAKVRAVRRAFVRYFPRVSVVPKRVASGVSNQPFSLAETVRGAKNRARRAFDAACDYAVGLESGLFPVPGSKTGFMDVGVCAIFDGRAFHVGLSPAFEYPRAVLRSLKKGREVKHYFQKLSGRADIHETLGAIGLLSKGVVTRDTFHEYSVLMALLPLAQPKLYAAPARRPSPRTRAPTRKTHSKRA